jgi:hypothetical protein
LTSNRTTDFLLIAAGTLLVIATFATVLTIPIYVGFNMVTAKAGDGTPGRVVLGSAALLAVAAACAAGAWALRRVIKRREAAGRP